MIWWILRWFGATRLCILRSLAKKRKRSKKIASNKIAIQAVIYPRSLFSGCRSSFLTSVGARHCTWGPTCGWFVASMPKSCYGCRRALSSSCLAAHPSRRRQHLRRHERECATTAVGGRRAWPTSRTHWPLPLPFVPISVCPCDMRSMHEQLPHY
jgi:hypothetical protein